MAVSWLKSSLKQRDTRRRRFPSDELRASFNQSDNAGVPISHDAKCATGRNMSQPNLKSATYANSHRRVGARRRVAWKPLAASNLANPHSASRPANTSPVTLASEYESRPRSELARGVRRRLGLASDITLLTIASPIFAVWWLYRASRKKLHVQRD
jgi:hypothetical protein